MTQKKILIADDEKDIVELIAYNLEREGYAVVKAFDGQKAWEMINADKPDLVILDLMMPGMDGFSVLEALRKQRETANIPVIVVTAKELTPQERRRLEGRISRLMTKGEFLSEDLLGEIGRALD